MIDLEAMVRDEVEQIRRAAQDPRYERAGFGLSVVLTLLEAYDHEVQRRKAAEALADAEAAATEARYRWLHSSLKTPDR